MVSNEEVTGIREGDPPNLKKATKNKSKIRTSNSSSARILIFAYSSAAIPLVVFFLCVFVINSGYSVALQRCFLSLLALSCVGSGVLSVMSLAAIKTTDDFVRLFVGAFFGVTG